jgi:hypothetical protein
VSALEQPSRDLRRRRRRRRWPRLVAGLVVVVVVFAAGVAVGMAIQDRPSPGGEQTIVRTFTP